MHDNKAGRAPLTEAVFLSAHLIVALVLGLLKFPPAIIVDDAFITFRYAANLASGTGFVYNAGENYLGTTTPLYALLLALGSPLFEKGILGVAVLLHLTAVVGLTLLVYLLFRGRPFRIVGLAFPLILLSNWYVRSTAGMEVLLFSASSLLAVYCWDRRFHFALGAVCALLCMIRPDGGVLGGLLLAATWWEGRKVPWRVFVAGAVVGLPWLLFSLPYFGSPLPNTVGAKYDQAQSYLWSVHSYGSDLLSKVVLDHSLLPCVGAVLCLGLILKRRDRLGFIVVLWTLIHNGLYAVTGVPSYPWYYVTFVVQTSFLAFYFVSFLPVGRLLQKRWFLGLRVAPTIAVVAALVVVSVAAARNRRVIRKFDDLSPDGNRYYHLGLWLKDNAPVDARVAVVEIGIIGYYSERYIVDLCGLVTPGISDHLKTGQHAKRALELYSPDYVLVREPMTGHEGGIENQLKWNYQKVHKHGDTAVYERVVRSESELAKLFLDRCTVEGEGAVYFANYPPELSREDFARRVEEGCRAHPIVTELDSQVRFVAELTPTGCIDLAELVALNRTRFLPEQLYSTVSPSVDAQLSPQGLRLPGSGSDGFSLVMEDLGLRGEVGRVLIRLSVAAEELSEEEPTPRFGRAAWSSTAELDPSRAVTFPLSPKEGPQRILLEPKFAGIETFGLLPLEGLKGEVVLHKIVFEEGQEGPHSSSSGHLDPVAEIEARLEGRAPGAVYLPKDSPGARARAGSREVRAASRFPTVEEWSPEVEYVAFSDSSGVLQCAALSRRGTVRIGAERLSRWNFVEVDESELQGDRLRVASGRDTPYFFGPLRLLGSWRRVRIRFEFQSEGTEGPLAGAIYWTSTPEEVFDEVKKRTYLFAPGDGEQEVVVEFPGESVDGLWDFRVNPFLFPGAMSIRELVFERY